MNFTRVVSALSVFVLVCGTSARTRAATGAPGAQVWRMSGRVVARDGHAFSYVASFFRYVRADGVVLYPAAASIIDELNGRIERDRRIERGGLGLAGENDAPLAVHVDDWRIAATRSHGKPAFTLAFDLRGASLALVGTAQKPRVALGGPDARHVQYTAIACRGTVTIDGVRSTVTGRAWLDDERFARPPSLAEPRAEFRVQLNDGREILIDGPAGSRAARHNAYLIERDGSVLHVAPDAYEFFDPLHTTWRSTHTRVMYPDLWALHVDGKTEFLSLEPVAFDQESLAMGDGASYWDGAVDVYDVTPGSHGLRLGSGYVLETGYAPEPGGSGR